MAGRLIAAPVPAAVAGLPSSGARGSTASAPADAAGYWVGGDVIKVLSMLMVVGIHTLVPQFNGLLNRDPAGGAAPFDGHWWFANILDSLFRISVPLFFMVSGALLATRDESIVGFFRKRLSRILLPLLAWSAVYLIWARHVVGVEGVPAVSELYRQPAYVHLWFLYALLLCYLAMPLMRPVLKYGAGLVVYALMLWAAIVLWMFFDDFRAGRSVSGITAEDYPYYIGYMLLGGAIAYYRVRMGILLSGALLLASWSATAVLTYRYSLSLGAPSEQFFGYFSPNVMIGAVAGFFLLNEWSQSLGRSGRRLFHQLGKLSFGVYLVHIIVLSHSLGYVLQYVQNSTVLALACFAINVLGSMVVIFVLSRIPGVRRLI